ncbi:MAG TPA: DNA polymerase III subunit gamma/tau [Acidimicrobiales bacterium]|nr:DNA polymerase III subunit gamma/tau [Acidimicrobiales bacterium]
MVEAQGTTTGDAGFVSLYRRFRPGRFGEVQGQPHVVRALQSAVRDGHVSHAYLFSGPRGTGKTSTARILARSLNCAAPEGGEPCGSCRSCQEIARGTSLDVHELDAASNNGVDAMRDLVAHAALGTPGRWKVYIVDEVHMLSTAAANALLKTLEEPPSHVVFVLATTDPQKVPPTIRSRTQHLEFRLLGVETLQSLLRGVRDLAGLDLDDAAVDAAVRRGRGSARDALSALDQFAAAGSAGDVRPGVSEIVDALCDEDASRLLVQVASLHEAGWGAQQLATEVVDELRQMFLLSLAPGLADVGGRDREALSGMADRLGLARVVRAMELIGHALVDMRDAPDPRVVLEVVLVRLARPQLDDSVAALADRLSKVERALAGSGHLAGSSRAAGQPSQAPTLAGPTPPEGGSGPAPGHPAAKPALGALRRRQSPSSGPAAASPVSEPPLAGAAGEGRGSAVRPGGEARAPVPPVPTSAGAAPPDRDSLVEAWGDHILRQLPARARALYGAGRFAAVEGTRARFVLPNAAHRDRCGDVRGVVEAAIADHFGVPVALELVVEGDPESAGGTPPVQGPHAEAARGAEVPGKPADPGGDEDLGAFDLEGLEDGGAVESIAEARLLQAFPGAEEVEG